MKVKRDYQRKNFKNPFFGTKPSTSKKARVGFFLCIIGICLFIYVAVSSYFATRSIDIGANQNANSKTTETVASVVLKTQNEEYYLDSNGLVQNQVAKTESVSGNTASGTVLIRTDSDAIKYKYPVIYDQANDQFQVGQKALHKETVAFVVAIAATIQSKGDFSISHFNIINSTISDIDLVTDEGWTVKFKADQSVADQLKSLFAVLNDKIRDRKNLHYIDVRYGDKIFYQ